MQHVKYLDGWRGLAITGVLLSHFSPTPGFGAGRFGVDLFFVLSGLLMSRILFEERIPLPVFYRRRIGRIVPVFLLFLVVIFLFARIMRLPWSSDEIVSCLLFLRTYFPSDVPIWSSAVPAGHIWSLNVEEHSYVFLAMIAAVPLFRKREGSLLLFAAALSLVIIVWYWKHPTTAPADWALRTECAATGLLLSAGYRQIRTHVRWLVRPWMAPVSLFLGAACYLWETPDWWKLLIAPFFLAFAVNEIGESYRFVVRTLEWKPLCMVGVWSYSIYLWQQPFYEFRHSMPTGLPLLLAIGVGLASFYFFEKPTRDWLNKHWGGEPSGWKHRSSDTAKAARIL